MPVVYLNGPCPVHLYSMGFALQIPAAPCAGFVRATMGQHGHARTRPAQIPVCARSNPVIGPAQDLTGHSGHAGQIPYGLQPGPLVLSIWAAIIGHNTVHQHLIFWPPTEALMTQRNWSAWSIATLVKTRIHVPGKNKFFDMWNFQVKLSGSLADYQPL